MYVCVLSIHGFAQNVPFEVCLEGINNNTKWYYVKINNLYIGADDQLKLFVSDHVKEDNTNKYLWAFIDAGKESFYLANRYLGNSYRLGSNSRSSVIQYGDLAVMKQGVGRKMHYKNTKNGGAGIYTKNMFNTYLGTNNSLVGFVDSSNKADIIVDFAKSESDINREIEAEKNRKAEEEKRQQVEAQLEKERQEQAKREAEEKAKQAKIEAEEKAKLDEKRREEQAKEQARVSEKFKRGLIKKYGKRDVDAAERGEIVIGMHEDVFKLLMVNLYASLSMKSDSGNTQVYDINSLYIFSTWIGRVTISNHRVAYMIYGKRWREYLNLFSVPLKLDRALSTFK